MQKELNLKEMLAHHPTEAYGAGISTYSLALEAWRRGIQVKFMTVFVKNELKIRHKLLYGGKEYKFQLSLGDKVAKEARKIGKSKSLTKEYLTAAGVSVPEGKVLKVKNADYTEICDFADTLGYPVIIKPAHASLTIGVHTNLTDRASLTAALDHVHGDLGYTDIIIERHAAGFDTRAYVIEDQVIAAFKRVPANITGDGESAVGELIELKNRERRMNPHLKSSQIEINDDLVSFVESQGYTFTSIPKKGERINLTSSTFAKDASDTVDITDDMTEDYKATAVNAVKSIPGMNMAGVDIIMDEEQDSNKVLEINCRPDIGGHLFPVEGKFRDVPGAIIDYYFPETAGLDKGRNEYFIFDYDRIINFMRKGTAREVTLPPLPKEGIELRELTLEGDVDRYRKEIFNAAAGHRLGGRMRKLDDGRTQLIAAGTEKHLTDFLLFLLGFTPKLHIEVTSENEWDTLLMYRFEVPEGMEPDDAGGFKNDIDEMKRAIEALQKEVAGLKKAGHEN
ncbi:hypothetical protein [Salinicoccus kekensis]|uniref:Acylphosphatase n=1 Tax=Salinicoccus kekensis TaxID=714307 RepID=A0A285UCA7_9STAP|nr:hypothetical protein [Salinicoccus kekensis]SOC39337.1 D-alanine-D-alanine ligase-like ATP-grasp enzyme [Salinicoccus kekensis]